MNCPKCNQEIGDSNKCIYCGHELAKPQESSYDTTIMTTIPPGTEGSGQSPVTGGSQPPQPAQPMGGVPQGQPPRPATPGMPQQPGQPLTPKPAQPTQPMGGPPQGQPPRPATPGMPQQPGQPLTPKPAQPAQPMGATPQGQPPGPGTPGMPQQPGQPLTPKPAQPAQPMGATPQGQPPRPGTPGMPQQPGQPLTPKPAQPVQPMGGAPQGQPSRPATPGMPQQPGQPLTPKPAQPAQPMGATPQGQPPRPATPGMPQQPSQPLTPKPAQPAQPMGGAPQGQPPRPATPGQPIQGGQPPQQADSGLMPPGTPQMAPEENSFEAPSGVIELAPMEEDEMELVGSSDFSPPEDYAPPAISRADEEPPAQGEGGFLSEDPEALNNVDGDIYQGDGPPRKAYIRENEKLSGNEVLFKLIMVVITGVSLLTLKVISTINMGMSNPYDKLSFIRLIIWAIVFVFTVYLVLQKELGNREGLFKKIIIFLAVAAFLGSFIGGTGVGTHPDSNFYTIEMDHVRLWDRGKAYARKPAFSPNNKMVVMNYQRDLSFKPSLAFLEINLENKEEPGKIKRTDIACQSYPYWYSQSEIIYPPEKASQYEAFRLNVLNLNMDAISTLYATGDYNFTMDFHFNYRSQRIVASYSGFVWILNPQNGEVLPISQLNSLYNQYEVLPDFTEFNTDTRGFITNLQYNLPAITNKTTYDIQPHMSHDGRYAYFLRTNVNRKQHSDIYRVDLEKIFVDDKQPRVSDGAELQEALIDMNEQITDDDYYYSCITVSPNGRFVAAWLRAIKGEGVEQNEECLVIYDTIEKAHLRIFPFYVTEAHVEALDWSPDGKHIVADMYSTLNCIIVLVDVPEFIQKLDEEAAIEMIE